MAEVTHSLDGRYYTDPKVFEIEQNGVLAETWQFAGHAATIPNAGDYFTFQLAGEDLFCIRGRDGDIQCFYNVCQHRAHQLVQGDGNAKVLVCPYHAWSYGLDGKLMAGPNIKSVRGFEKSEICLTSVKIENMHGFIFANLDPNAKPMEDWFPNVRDELAAHVPDIDRLKPVEWVEIPENCNWKVSIENYTF